MEFGITLSSLRAQEVNSYNKPENFVTRLDMPIRLDENKKYVVGLRSGIMHYSWHNISSDHNNNKIEYKVTEDEPYRTLTFRPGMYDYSDLDDYIDEWLKTEGIISKKDIKKRVEKNPPIFIEFNLATYHCSIYLEDGYSIKFNKEFGNLIGFEPGEYSGRNEGTKTPNITNSLDYLYIHCSLTTNSIVDGEYGDIIEMITLADKERSYPFVIEPRKILYNELNSHTIQSIKIYITDPLGRIINLNDAHTSFNLIIKEVKY